VQRLEIKRDARRVARGTTGAPVCAVSRTEGTLDAMGNAASRFHVRLRAGGDAPVAQLRSALRTLLAAGFRGAAGALSEDVPVRLAGELHVAGALYDVVAMLAQAGRSGTLVVTSPEAVRALSIERGDLVSACTTAPNERIGEVLYRSGEIAREDIDEALMVSAIDGRRLGEVLVALGRASASSVDSRLERQAEEIFYAALRVDDGVFCFVDECIGAELADARRARSSLTSLLMEAARRMDEMLLFRERVPSSRHIPERASVVPPSGRELAPELAAVLDRCDGCRSVAEIGRAVGLLEFEVTQAIHRLAVEGRVEIAPPRVRGSEDIVAVFNDALVELHRRCDRLRCGDDLRRALDRYVACEEEMRALMRGVAPHDDGSLDASRLLRNAGSTRRDAIVKRALGGYLDFAAFHAGSLLPCSMAAELPARLARVFESLAGGEPLSTRTPCVLEPVADAG
jgi:hypothetical protein